MLFLIQGLTVAFVLYYPWLLEAPLLAPTRKLYLCGLVIFHLLWRGKLAFSRPLFAALVGLSLPFGMAHPVLTFCLVWPTLAQRFAACEKQYRPTLALSQLALAACIQLPGSGGEFCRACAALAGLAALFPKLTGPFATLALTSGLAPILDSFLRQEPEAAFLQSALVALLLFPQWILKAPRAVPPTVPRRWLTIAFVIASTPWWLWLFQGCRFCGMGELTRCKSNCKNLATALEMYASDNQGQYPTELQELTANGYLKALPTCPATHRMTYQDYRVGRQPQRFRFSCCGNNHARAYTGFQAPSDNYPQYDCEEGLLDHP